MGNNTYIADTTNSITINKEITIRGGLKLNDGKYSTLDGRGMTTIIKVTSTYNMVFDSIIFLNGFSNTNRGAFLVDRSGSYTYEFINCKFINNIAHNGAAIYADYSYSGSSPPNNKLNIINSTFINNKAINGEGGAIFDGNCFQVTIKNSNFFNNVAKTKGGAVFSRYYKATFISSNFINNSAADEGGAIYTQQSQYDISYCFFTNIILQTMEARTIVMHMVVLIMIMLK